VRTISSWAAVWVALERNWGRLVFHSADEVARFGLSWPSHRIQIIPTEAGRIVRIYEDNPIGCTAVLGCPQAQQLVTTLRAASGRVPQVRTKGLR